MIEYIKHIPVKVSIAAEVIDPVRKGGSSLKYQILLLIYLLDLHITYGM